MKVRIVNDGGPGYQTKITNAETGEDLSGMYVTELTIRVKDDMPYVVLTSAMPMVDVIADAEIKHVCPYCGKPEEPGVLADDCNETTDEVNNG